jgi:hypothetical protein
VLGGVGGGVAERLHGAMELGVHGVDQDRSGGWFGLCRCRCREVADGGDGHDYQTGETDAGNCDSLSLHGNWNSFRLQKYLLPSVSEVLPVRATRYSFRCRRLIDWTSESTFS